MKTSPWKCRVLATLSVLLWGGACRSLVCDDEVIAKWPSPDRTYTATVVTRACGATEPDFTVVMVHRTAKDYDRNGDRDDVFVTIGRIDVEPTWTGQSTLLVKIKTAEGNVRKRVTRLGDVDISYAEMQ